MRRRLTVQLIAVFLWVGTAWAVEVKTATHLQSYAWRHPADWFGGFSALHISDNGHQMLALSDRALMLTARIKREGDQISAIDVQDQWPVLSSTGQIMKGAAGDSEGLALAGDGSFFISFEGVHRVVHFKAPDARSKVLPRPKVFDALSRNGSFESLAIDAQGRLLALTEKSRAANGEILVYRWDGQAWSSPFGLPARGKFQPVSADFGPEGRLYVLERAVSVLGFRSRLRRWDIVDDSPRSEEILFETGTGTHDNLEGLSVWRDGQDRLRATMISDDNFLALQRTELVEYLLPD
ncbi:MULTISPECIES: esterase-like activity of phytase family protein [unclassified Ruegeria]|uniref:esterase-like activity of phytase family protein n=1 Tax=unclassified Ruegeria TaxID=2625375 RepID=UPI001487DA49|nr:MULTISPECIES: esterase-like activity of phytase family protein [unclassified Ruegeria]